MDAHFIFKTFLVLWQCIGIAGTVLLVGVERKPTTPGVAAFAVLIGGAIAYGTIALL